MSDLTYFKIECGVGVMIMRAPDRRAASRAAKTRHGTVSAPYKTKLASYDDMQSHLRSGCVFFEKDFSLVPKDEAYRDAHMPARHTHHCTSHHVARPSKMIANRSCQ